MRASESTRVWVSNRETHEPVEDWALTVLSAVTASGWKRDGEAETGGRERI